VANRLVEMYKRTKIQQSITKGIFVVHVNKGG
jgi:hypothetical protein